jgi:hypothetical protein
MKTKRGKSGTGLSDYVKKSDSEEKMVKVLNKQGEAVFVKKSKVKENPNDYKPVPSKIEQMLKISDRKKALELAKSREPGRRLSLADIELAKNAVSKRRGGAMLKNPGKADLDKDGKLSGYEKKRGMAIEKAMGAKRGKFAKTRKKFGPEAEFKTYNQMRDLFDRQKKMQQRKKDMEKDKLKIEQNKKGIAVKSGGMIKYNKGGGADTGTKGELRSKLGVATNKFKRVNKMLKKIGKRMAPKRPKLQAPERGPMKPLKAKEGKAIVDPKATLKKRIKNDPRTRDQRVKDAFPKKSPRGRAVISTLGSQNPMKRDRLMEGAKARRRKMFTDALRKLGAAGRSLTPAGAAGPLARRIKKQISKKSVGGNVLHKLKSQKEIKKITDSDEYKKADYFGKTKMLGGKAYTAKEMEKKISKKMGGGMMMKPMGYKSGTSVMARGCKLGRKKATKIM